MSFSWRSLSLDNSSSAARKVRPMTNATSHCRNCLTQTRARTPEAPGHLVAERGRIIGQVTDVVSVRFGRVAAEISVKLAVLEPQIIPRFSSRSRHLNLVRWCPAVIDGMWANLLMHVCILTTLI